ncbi:DUF4282 domain-containing protein [Terrabacter sp. MAHUQ-38]|uniref:DUF4282 domain-containing protein n=1 Tax=unclassified Terrabacter TaxID=2630222 RepID=UPI00165E3758|nr:DUF4282 domain-containing protein [Terrabacter sp. MAHUQ-38]MBC9823734.1 DUF4282 domain-containing protein [Terrabacter sp. MAHUQ-38]
MSDPNPPEQPSFNQPAGTHPTTPMPTGQPASSSPSASSSRGAGTPPPAPTGGATGMSSIPHPAKEGAGFLSALFDFSFTNFVTPILVRFVYLLATVALVASWLIFVFVGFAQGFGSGLTALILGPIILVIYLAVIRMTLEFYLSVVRMSEDIHRRLPQA